MRRFLRLLPLFFFFTLTFYSCKTSKLSISQKAKEAQRGTYTPQKHEMRAIWMATVFHDEYTKMTPAEMRKYLVDRLNEIKATGFNTLVFQVRPESDAFYRSELEPWSRFLTGNQGQAPSPEWDPMEFLIEECHKRGLEFHAWINPYRAQADNTKPLDPMHPVSRHPEWFLKYGKLTVYNPGLKESREFIIQVVSDMVSRYDLDAIHMDDYFYPYPIAGVEFPDMQTYLQDPRGFRDIKDWRRDNVNQLIRDMHHAIRSIKPYVRLGISPFGIYRNISSDPNGSRTGGLQNYDELYADILLWDKMGWVDYIMPQLYWQMGHKAADYTELAYWWQRNIHNSHFYIGQSVKRTMDSDELHPKLVIAGDTSEGNCMWPGEEIFRNYKGVRDALKKIYWRFPALVPPSHDIHGSYTYPRQVTGLRTEEGPEGLRLVWDALPSTEEQGNMRYVIYFYEGNRTKRNLSEPQHILAVTRDNYFDLPALDGDTKMVYFVTALNRYNCESTEAPFVKVKH